MKPLHLVGTMESKVLSEGTEPLLSPSATVMFQSATGPAADVVPPEGIQEAPSSHLQDDSMPALAALGVTRIGSPVAARVNATLAGIDAAMTARWRGQPPVPLAAKQDPEADDASDAPSSASSDRVDQLTEQVQAMQEQMLQQFSAQQQMALQAAAREDALQKKVEALEAERARMSASAVAAAAAHTAKTPSTFTVPVPVSETALLSAASPTFNPYTEHQVRLSSSEMTGCLFSGKRVALEWATAKKALADTVGMHSKRMAAMIRGKYMREDAMAFGEAAVNTWDHDNFQLESLVFRAIRHDTPEGVAMRGQIVQDNERNVLAPNDGVALLKMLDDRVSFQSTGEKREGAAELKKMKMHIGMTKAEVDAFASSALDLYSKLAGEDSATMGSFYDVLFVKMPEACKAGAATLRLMVETEKSLHGRDIPLEKLKVLISGEITNVRLDSGISPSAAASGAGFIAQPDPTAQQMEKLTKGLALLAEKLKKSKDGKSRKKGGRGDKKCLNCGGSCKSFSECTAKPCSKCGLKLCGSPYGVPCRVAADSEPPDDAKDVNGQPLTPAYRVMLTKRRAAFRLTGKASANVAGAAVDGSAQSEHIDLGARSFPISFTGVVGRGKLTETKSMPLSFGDAPSAAMDGDLRAQQIANQFQAAAMSPQLDGSSECPGVSCVHHLAPTRRICAPCVPMALPTPISADDVPSDEAARVVAAKIAEFQGIECTVPRMSFAPAVDFVPSTQTEQPIIGQHFLQECPMPDTKVITADQGCQAMILERASLVNLKNQNVGDVSTGARVLAASSEKANPRIAQMSLVLPPAIGMTGFSLPPFNQQQVGSVPGDPCEKNGQVWGDFGHFQSSNLYRPQSALFSVHTPQNLPRIHPPTPPLCARDGCNNHCPMNYSTGRYYKYCSPVCQTGGTSDPSSPAPLEHEPGTGTDLSVYEYMAQAGYGHPHLSPDEQVQSPTLFPVVPSSGSSTERERYNSLSPTLWSIAGTAVSELSTGRGWRMDGFFPPSHPRHFQDGITRELFADSDPSEGDDWQQELLVEHISVGVTVDAGICHLQLLCVDERGGNFHIRTFNPPPCDTLPSPPSVVLPSLPLTECTSKDTDEQLQILARPSSGLASGHQAWSLTSDARDSRPVPSAVDLSRMIELTVDSGTTDTTFSTKELLLHAKKSAPPFQTISVGNAAHPVVVHSAVSVPLMLVGKDKIVMLNVLGVHADMARDLLSTGHLWDTMRVKCVMDDVMKMFLPTGEYVPIHRDEIGLFVVRAAIPTQAEACAFVAQALRNDERALLWHARMMHTPESFNMFVKHGRGHSIERTPTSAMLRTIESCRVRAAALQRAAPHPKTAPEEVRADKPGARLVLDGFGPTPTKCFVTGHNYIMLGVCEYSSCPLAESTLEHTNVEWLAFLDAAIAWLALWHHKVLVVRTDGAGEFVSDPWKTGLKQRKLLDERSAPHEKDHVGLAEVYVKLMQEHGRAFVIRANLPDGYMILACLYAVMVIQHKVRRGDTTSRRAVVTNSDGYTDRLRVFGCPMDGLVAFDSRKNKVAPITRRGVFIGITRDGLWQMYSENRVWLVMNNAQFYEVGLLREGVVPKHGTHDAETQWEEDAGAASTSTASTVPRAPASTSVVPAATGPRPDGGRFEMRARARAQLVHRHEQLSISQACNAADAMQLFESEECPPAHCKAMAAMAMLDNSIAADAVHALSQPYDAVSLAAARGSKLVHVIGPQGPYTVEQPGSHGAMKKSKDMPAWMKAQIVHVQTITSHQRLVAVPRSEAIAAGVQIYVGHWVYAVRVHRVTGELDKLKARYVLDGQWWCEGGETYASFPPPECINVLLGVTAIDPQRKCMLIDVKDFFQEHDWPDGECRYLEMPPDHVEYDDKGVQMVWRANKLFWGAPVASHTCDQATLEFYHNIGGEQMDAAPRCHRIRLDSGDTYAVTHADDNLISYVGDEQRDAIIAAFKKRYNAVTVVHQPEEYKGNEIAWGEDRITIRCMQRVVDIAVKYYPDALLEEHNWKGMPPSAARLLDELSAYKRPEGELPKLSKDQKLVQRWTGDFKYIDNILVGTMLYVHALSRHMAFPPAEPSIQLLRLLMVYSLSVAEIGNTFSRCDTRVRDLEGYVKQATARKQKHIDKATLAYYDASHMAPPVKSIQAHAVQCFGGLLSAVLTCIPSTMKASFNAELYSALSCGQHVEWIRDVAVMFGVCVDGPTAMLGDNQSVLLMSMPGATPAKSKPDAKRVAILQELARQPHGCIAPEKVHTDYNRVDMLTKHVDVDKQWRSLLQLVNAVNRVPPKRSMTDMVAVALELLSAPSVALLASTSPACDELNVGLPAYTIPAHGLFVLFLCSGPRRAGDLGECMPAVHVVFIDILFGIDLRDEDVVNALIAAAKSTRCVAAMLSPECSKWSAAHFLPTIKGKPGCPYRDAGCILGFPDANGNLPAAVLDSNLLAANTAKIALAAGFNGARVIAETPAPRGVGLNGTTPAWPTDTLKGAERHVYLFDHPAYVMLRAALNGGVVVCDLCEFSDPLSLGPEKATAFLASQNAFVDVQRMFADKRCTHGKAAHGAAMRGAASAGGGYATAGSEHYSRVLCEALAACLWPAGAGGAASV